MSSGEKHEHSFSSHDSELDLALALSASEEEENAHMPHVPHMNVGGELDDAEECCPLATIRMALADMRQMMRRFNDDEVVGLIQTIVDAVEVPQEYTQGHGGGKEGDDDVGSRSVDTDVFRSSVGAELKDGGALQIFLHFLSTYTPLPHSGTCAIVLCLLRRLVCPAVVALVPGPICHTMHMLHVIKHEQHPLILVLTPNLAVTLTPHHITGNERFEANLSRLFVWAVSIEDNVALFKRLDSTLSFLHSIVVKTTDVDGPLVGMWDRCEILVLLASAVRNVSRVVAAEWTRTSGGGATHSTHSQSQSLLSIPSSVLQMFSVGGAAGSGGGSGGGGGGGFGSHETHSSTGGSGGGTSTGTGSATGTRGVASKTASKQAQTAQYPPPDYQHSIEALLNIVSLMGSRKDDPSKPVYVDMCNYNVTTALLRAPPPSCANLLT